MQGPLMVERQAAPEVAGLNQRDRQPALRGIEGGEQSVNPAADDEQIPPAPGEGVRLSVHASPVALAPV